MKRTLILLLALGLSQANAYVLPQKPVKFYDCELCANLSHESLQDRWNITEEPLFKTGSNIQKSYSYDRRVSAKQLEEGVALSINSSGAVIHITPLQDKAIPLLEIKASPSPFMNLKEASSLYSSNEALDESLHTGPHQTMFQLKPELGSGQFIIKSKKTKSKDKADSYLIHVFEKYSSVYLQIEPSALQYQYGDQFHATITMEDALHTYSKQNINASLVGPFAQNIPVKIKEVQHNTFQASASLSSEINPNGDNWYIEVDVTQDQKDINASHRSGHAAFSYSIPSASLVSIQKISSNPLTLSATVNVSTASRYGLQSMLYTRNDKGKLIPVETAQSASWLEPGKQIIKFGFDNSDHIDENRLLVGYLHLTDFGQFKTVYQHDSPINLSQLLD